MFISSILRVYSALLELTHIPFGSFVLHSPLRSPTLIRGDVFYLSYFPAHISPCTLISGINKPFSLLDHHI